MESWRVSPGLAAIKIAGALILALVAVFTALTSVDRIGVAIATAAAVGLSAFALRDVIAPVRVAADQEGVTVIAGFARRVRFPWSKIDLVRVDTRSRYGLRSEHLEIDAGESVHLFSAAELSAPVADVAAALDALRQGVTRSGPG